MLSQGRNLIRISLKYMTRDMINLLFIRHRKHWHTHGSQGAVFHKMRAALLMSDSRRNGVYRRIIMSGAGTVVKVAHEFS